MSERDIFDAALAIDDLAERGAYLDRVCAEDARLRKHLEELLSVLSQVGSFLEQPAVALEATVDDPIRERLGTVIGPYKLMEQIGEGGMGLVFVAEQQQPVRRKVALKVIKPGMDTRQVVARFEAERQALALMDHPNIAKVLDGGTTDSGRPYFVMELVKGVPITDYCDQNQVPIRQRLELFVSVCQAVQHAHQKGIIHRDLKPSNVLVVSHDGTPVVKVIDFGVAKAIGQQLTDKTIYTQFSQMIGTPLYMSPEQAGQSGLDVDTRSDIYSLGVLLYELLTGTTPFDKERLREVGYDEMRRIIREEEPPKPSTRISTLGQVAATVSTQRRSEPRQLRGELDWIVMKALEKGRNRRYETANGLAMDVQRYLHDEPVMACPPSSWYRFRKFARRNWAVLATTLLVATALLITILALGISNVAISRKEKELAQALEDKDAALKTAQANEAWSQIQEHLARHNLRKACDAVDQMLNRVAEERLLNAPRMMPTRLALLQDAARFYEEFVRQEGEASEPWLRLEVGKAYQRLGVVMYQMGQWNRAMEASQRAITRLDQLRTEDPSEHNCRRILADAYAQLGTISRVRGHRARAEKLFEKAIDLYSQLAVEAPNEADFRIAYADCQVALLGEILLMTSRFHEAEPILRAALETRQKLKAESPSDPTLCGSVAETRAVLAELLQKTGRRAEAQDMRRQALVLIDKLVEDFPALLWHRESQQKCLVAMVIAEEQPQEAERLYQRVVASLERLVADWPEMLEYRYLLGRLHLERGISLHWSVLKKAEQAYHRALTFLQRRGRLPEAEKAFQQAVQTLEKLLAAVPDAQPKQRALLGDTYAWLGSLLAAAGRREEALAAMQKARDFPPHDAGDYSHLAELLATCSDPEVKDGRRAVELARKAVELAPEDGNYWSILGLVYCSTADWKEAIGALEKSNALIHRGPEHLQNAFCLAIAHGRLGNKEPARHWYDQAVAWMEKYAPQNADLRRLRAEAEKSLGNLNMLDGKAKNGKCK